MSKNPRLHEVAKAIGVSVKVLRHDLSVAGFEYKTHMAALEDDAMKVVQKKYPQVDKALAEAEKAAPKKAATKKKKTTSSSKKKAAAAAKVISSRSVVRRKKADEDDASEEKKSSKVEIVIQEEGVAVEQKKIGGGIIRRRRVEAPPVVPEEKIEATPAADETAEESTPVEEIAAEAAPSEEFTVNETQEVGEISEPELPAEPETSVSASSSVSEEAPSSKTEEIVPETSTGRNLSAGRRLKIVGQSTPPRKEAPSPRPKPGVPVAGDATPRETPTEADAAAAAKKKGAGVHKNWEAPKVTKRDLLGMTEEVEISTRSFSRRPKKQSPRTNQKTQITTPSAKKRVIKIDGDITVADLADRMSVKAADLVRKLIKMGMMVNAHQSVDFDTATLLASEYDYEIQNVEVTAESFLLADESESRPEDLEERAPIVTIMGHVDHGKTSLLDKIRSSRVAAGEAGGITQHIGAYQVERAGKKITFLDTPGHEAFTKMRARGAAVTDISILVVAADEGPKPQTLEALAHARDAKTPVIVAITKIDKPEANPDKVIQELSAYELIPEDWGGDTMFCRVSAVSGEGLEDLLDRILLQAEVMELKADPNRTAKAVVIESRLDKGKGPVASVVITDGSLEQGQPVVSGMSFGKIRAIFDDQGRMIKKAGPATPVEILGLNEVPEAGDSLMGVSEEGVARKAAELLANRKKAEDLRKASRISLEEMYSKMKAGEVTELRVVLKGDVQGSVEAVADALAKITHDEVKVNVVYKAVGAVSESDVSLAAASGALVIGFNVRPTNQAKSLAAQESIQLKSYSIIYELIDDVKLAMQGLLSPDIKEEVLGQAEVRDVFSLSKSGTVAGCYVISGKITRNGYARLLRDNVVIYEDKIDSLKRFKDDAKEVAEGFECGIKLENYTDVKVGDVIECFEKIEVAKAVS